MANWGLLAGAGRGISQGAGLLAQGMAEDREAERQRLREASAAARWQRQEQREDKRYADEKKYREDRNSVEDARYKDQVQAQKDARAEAKAQADRSYSLQERQLSAAEEARRVQRIEETLNRIQSKYSREGEQIDRKYDRLIDKADSPEEKEALGLLRDKAHEDIGMKLNAEMLPALKSFGNDLKGTAYATYIDELANMESDAENSKGRKFLQDAGVVDAEGNYVNQPGSSAGSGRAAKVQQIISGNGSVTSGTGSVTQNHAQSGLLKPGFFNGFIDSAHGNINPMQIDETNITPAQLATTRTGQALGYFPGKFVDAVQQVEQAAQPAWNYLNKPIK